MATSTGTGRTDWTGRELRLELGGPAHGGEFVARHEGRVVFVRGGITGETVTAEVVDDPGRGFCRAVATEIVRASEHRVEPMCPAAARGAGCCDWTHIDPDEARRLKARVLREQLERIGGIRLDESVDVVAPGGNRAATGWRSVARLVADARGRPGVRARRSHEVITVPCAQLTSEIVDAVAAVRWRPGHEILAVHDDTGTVHLASRPAAESPRRVRGRTGHDRRRGRASSSRAAAETRAPWRLVENEGRGEDGRGDEPAGGADGMTTPVRRRVGAVTWELPLDTFWQAHIDSARHYSRVVSEELAGWAPERVWDLYGGAGLFTAAARAVVPGVQLTLVETAPSAVAAARRTFRSDVDVIRAGTLDFLAREPGDGQDVDAIVIDPPRGGAGLEVMRMLAESGAGVVIHVGCDPASLARDVGALHTAGWRLRSLSGVDAFPGTHHVEGIAVLENSPSARGPAGRS